jgi:hypothetical protein
MAALVGMSPGLVLADATLIGQSGLVHMPDARIAEEGTLSIGASNIDPYLRSEQPHRPPMASCAVHEIDRVPGAARLQLVTTATNLSTRSCCC